MNILDCRITGQANVPKASATAFANGDEVFWNVLTSLAEKTLPINGFKLGGSHGAAAAGTTSVLVDVDAIIPRIVSVEMAVLV